MGLDTVGTSRDVWYSAVHNQKNGEMSTESPRWKTSNGTRTLRKTLISF